MGKPSKDYAVPLWEKANLTIYEAAAYSGIGADKLRELSDSCLLYTSRCV